MDRWGGVRGLDKIADDVKIIAHATFMQNVVNNMRSAITDVTVQDVLDAAFQYQTATIQVDNSVVKCALHGGRGTGDIHGGGWRCFLVGRHGRRRGELLSSEHRRR